ncbi:hypothetical protein SASPL_157852 [Salvia splendens]|uniref:Uncharacterized protein n=1 Tax=Salvia splendens TaxID=180675 RepID=A0A8X8YTL5_SALSN|nr:hypothetical protein SASPL_157852 [Salvia splendens]
MVNSKLGSYDIVGLNCDAASALQCGNKKTLILQEIPEDGVKKLLSKNESLGACDVAVFVDDRLGYFATYQEFSQVVKSYHD